MTEELTEEDMDNYAQTTELQGNLGYPTPPPRESVFKFFRELLKSKDSSKFGNLQQAELGLPEITVRGYQGIAIDLEKAWGMDKVGEYLRQRGESILATSLSKKGFLAELFVTQIRREKKGQPVEIKKGLFSGFKKQQSGEMQ